MESIVGWRRGEDAETEVLLKWKGTAFVHCTWAKVTAIESDVVSGTHGKRRVARFFDKLPQQLGPCVDVKPQYLVVDRVFSKLEEQDRTWVCVKWDRMSYDETTWEDVALVRGAFEGGAKALEDFERVSAGAQAASERQAVVDAETEAEVTQAWSSYEGEPVRDLYLSLIHI